MKNDDELTYIEDDEYDDFKDDEDEDEELSIEERGFIRGEKKASEYKE